MLKTWIGILAALALLTACAAADVRQEPVRVEGTPGVAVIYLVRTSPDVSYLAAPVVLDERLVGPTYAGTYYRLEVPAGRHRFSGYAQDSGALTLEVQADRIYFVQHTVVGSWRETSPYSFFKLIDEARGRAAMAGASRLG
jgi:hypothetical protein